jgi:hypothetical protein
MPRALDAYARFLTHCHDGLTGRIPGICFAIKSDAKKVGEAFRGGLAITLFTVFKIMDVLPDVVIPGFGYAFRLYGYRVVKDHQKSSPLSERDAVADVAKSAGDLEAEAFRAFDGHGFDPRLRRGLRHRVERMERALFNFRPHVEEVA